MSVSLYIITGANKGFGGNVSFNICKNTQDPIQLILVGRDDNSLQLVKNNIEQQKYTHIQSIDIISHPHILDNAEKTSQHLLPALDSLISPISGNLNKITLINNAGSTGDLSKKVHEYDLGNIQQYIDLNITSYVTLNSGILKLYNDQWKTEKNQLILVNISSLLAIQPFANWGLYATGKAARDMMMGIISKEHNSNVRTLSYSPGPLDNEMQKSVRESLGDPEQEKIYTDMANKVNNYVRGYIGERKGRGKNQNKTKKEYKEYRERIGKGNLVKMDDSALKLINLLKENTFTSGSHIDYYDV